MHKQENLIQSRGLSGSGIYCTSSSMKIGGMSQHHETIIDHELHLLLLFVVCKERVFGFFVRRKKYKVNALRVLAQACMIIHCIR